MKKIRSHTVYIRLLTRSTLDEVGSPSAANGRSPNAAQCKGNYWADNFQWSSEQDKTLVSHAPFIRPCYCLLFLSLWKFISVRSRSRTNYAKTLIRLCGCACWSDSLRGTPRCHIWFVVLWVIFKIRSSCTRHFGVLAFPVSLLRAWFRVGLSFTNKNWLKYFYSNVCKDSCFVLKKYFSVCFCSISKLCTDPLLFAEFGLISVSYRNRHIVEMSGASMTMTGQVKSLTAP